MRTADQAAEQAVRDLARSLAGLGIPEPVIRGAFIRWAAGSASGEAGTVLAYAAELRAAADAIEVVHAKLSSRGRA